MSFRISLQKSAWSCETNMSSAIDQGNKAHDARLAQAQNQIARTQGAAAAQRLFQDRLLRSQPLSSFGSSFLLCACCVS